MVVGFTTTYAIGADRWFSRGTPIMKRNSDGHQFHQCQQNKQSLLILIKLAEHKKKTMIYDIGNPGPGLGQAQQSGGVNLVNVIPTLAF
jgi:hypothetical protein